MSDEKFDLQSEDEDRRITEDEERLLDELGIFGESRRKF